MQDLRLGDWLWTVEPGPRWGRVLAWVFTVFLAIQFLLVGGSKLVGTEVDVENFDRWQLPQWFRPVVGSLEVTWGVLLLIPRTRALGAAAVSVTMFVAVFVNLRVGLLEGMWPPAVLMVWGLVILWFNRPAAVWRGRAAPD